MMTEALRSSKTSAERAARFNIPKDSLLYSRTNLLVSRRR
jgi:hypothetical protein